MKRHEYRITEDEQILVSLKTAADKAPLADTRERAASLIMWFLRNGEWTYKQKMMARSIALEFKTKIRLKEKVRHSAPSQSNS